MDRPPPDGKDTPSTGADAAVPPAETDSAVPTRGDAQVPAVDPDAAAEPATDGGLADGGDEDASSSTVLEPCGGPCPDPGPCKTVACNEVTDTCEQDNVANDTACEDGLFCTEDGVCRAGECVSTPRLCGTSSPLACVEAACDEDADRCVEVAQPGFCLAADSRGGDARCWDDDEADPLNECLRCVADVARDRLTPAAAGGSCDDFNDCTYDDRCTAQGACRGTDNTAGCDDDIPCTADNCDPTGNACLASEPMNGMCLVDGACYVEGARNPANDCEGCFPEADNRGFTAEDLEGEPCDRDNACTDRSCDDSGVCEEGQLRACCSVPAGDAEAQPVWCNGLACVAIPLAANQRVAVTRLNTGERTITLQNGTGSNLVMDGWTVCFGAAACSSPIGALTIGPGAEQLLRFGRVADGAPEVAVLDFTLPMPDASEFAVYNTGDAFDSSSAIEAYLRYESRGATGAGDVREEVALGHDGPLWTEGDILRIPAVREGAVLIDLPYRADGYLPVDAGCL